MKLKTTACPNSYICLSVLTELSFTGEPGLSAVALVPPTSLHLTLCYTDWVALDTARAIGESLQACGPLPALAFSGALELAGAGNRMSLLALVKPTDELLQFRASIAMRLERMGVWFEPEFKPHITIARATSQQSGSLSACRLDPAGLIVKACEFLQGLPTGYPIG